jgi:hypothetical protein
MTIKDIVKLACPAYTGRKITAGTIAPKYLDSYWEDGYRTYYHFVRLQDKLVHTVHSNHPTFEPQRPRYLVNTLPEGWALVEQRKSGMKESMVVYHGTGTDPFPMLRA